MLPLAMLGGALSRPDLQQVLSQYGDRFPFMTGAIGRARDAYMGSPLSRIGRRPDAAPPPAPGPLRGIARYQGGPVSAYAYAKSQGWV